MIGAIVHLPRVQFILAVNAFQSRTYNLETSNALCCKLTEVAQSGGDVDNQDHDSSAEFRGFLAEAIHVCGDLWKWKVAPQDFTA